MFGRPFEWYVESRSRRPANRTRENARSSPVVFCASPRVGSFAFTVKEILGHKTLTLTARYSRLSPGNQRHALDPLADRLDRQDWWRRVDSNHRHRAYETPALPTELRRHGRSYGTSPEGGLAEDQRIIEKRTDGVKPRLASTAPCGRVADLRGRFSVAGATSRPSDDVVFRVVRARAIPVDGRRRCRLCGRPDILA